MDVRVNGMSSAELIGYLENPASSPIAEPLLRERAVGLIGALKKQLTHSEDEVLAALRSLGRDAIRVREGAGAENVYASLAVTMARLSKLLGVPEERFVAQIMPCREDNLPHYDEPVLAYIATLPQGERWQRAVRRAHGNKWSWAGGQSGWPPEAVTQYMRLPAEREAAVRH